MKTALAAPALPDGATPLWAALQEWRVLKESEFPEGGRAWGGKEEQEKEEKFKRSNFLGKVIRRS